MYFNDGIIKKTNPKINIKEALSERTTELRLRHLERQYSFGNLVQDWLDEKRRLQKNKIIENGIYSRYHLPKPFTDLPKMKTSHAYMRKCNLKVADEKFPARKEFYNKEVKKTCRSPVCIPVANQLYKLRYKHRPHFTRYPN